MKDCLVAPNLPEKPKVAPIIHERPKMPARTWSALRSHILTERKKKREEEGKQKEEERRKREREHRAKQEANNLEVGNIFTSFSLPEIFSFDFFTEIFLQETKEQIAGLETKLASLKEEKHQLFLTLKKVLNEDDVRRKKESSELSSLYPQNSHPNVLPLSGHIVQPPGSSRYIQPGQSGSGEARGRSAYMKPPGGSSYHSSQQHFPYLPPLITTTATGRVKTCRGL